jgi:hypothetical protein
LSAAFLLICAGPAAAADAGEPDPERKAAANAHLKRGAELIDAEDLPGALAQFEAAYRLVPSPSILHNFGIVYQGLGRKAEALDAFQRFLDEADKAPPATREHARQAVQALKREVAELRVESDVAGASIFVDKRKVGQTPQERPIYLDPGPHQLSVEKAGLATGLAQRVEATAGQQLTVPARLSAPPSAVVAAEPRGAEPEASPRAWQRPAAWVTAAAATAAAGVFVTELVVRHLRVTDFNSMKCGTALEDMQGGPKCPGLAQGAHDAEKWALVSGVAAGALGIGAAVLFLTLPDSGTQVSLQASPAHLGFGLQGRF